MSSDPTSQVPLETQAKVRRFFEVYDPERLESSDFNVLLRYIVNKGLPALEGKLLKKYGVNIATMEQENKRTSVNYTNQNNPGAPNPPNAPADGEREMWGSARKSNSPAELDELPQHGNANVRGASGSPDEAQSGMFQKRATMGTIKQIAGFDPDTEEMENHERAMMFQRLTEFYKKYNRDKLQDGIGDVVDYAMRKGLDRLNKKFKQTYGADLTSFEESNKAKQRQSAQFVQNQLRLEEQNVGQMAPARQELRQKLVDFFLIVEPQRAELQMDPLLDFAEKNGQARLDEKLDKKYGYNLANPPQIKSQQPQEEVRAPPPVDNYTYREGSKPQPRLDKDLRSMKRGDLPEYVRLMLGRYYARYDQLMLKDNGVDAVYSWTRRNGLDKLNRKLADLYGQSLQDFIQMSNELRDDLIEFYRHRDKNKLVTGIRPILDWGLRNGRTALNEKLRGKYGVGLDAEVDMEIMESASQF